MEIVVAKIAEYLGVSVERAQEVRDRIDEDDLLDWSEATEEECRAAYREASAALSETG